MEIKGQISEIIYQNEVNSYTIAEFETEEELTVIVGYLPFINKGDSLKLVGNFVNHPDYGRQFKIQTFEKIMPETLEALENTTDIQVDLGTQSVLVETGATDELIRQAIDEAGYTVLGID